MEYLGYRSGLYNPAKHTGTSGQLRRRELIGTIPTTKIE